MTNVPETSSRDPLGATAGRLMGHWKTSVRRQVRMQGRGRYAGCRSVLTRCMTIS